MIYAPDGRKSGTKEMTPLAKAALVLVIQSPGMNAGAIQTVDRRNWFLFYLHDPIFSRLELSGGWKI